MRVQPVAEEQALLLSGNMLVQRRFVSELVNELVDMTVGRRFVVSCCTNHCSWRQTRNKLCHGSGWMIVLM